MKPRFSILTLLVVTAYVAFSMACAIYPATVWSTVQLHVWLAIVVMFGIEFTSGRQGRAAFAGGMVVSCLA